MNENIIAIAAALVLGCVNVGCAARAHDVHDAHGANHGDDHHDDGDEDAHGHEHAHEVPTDPAIVAAAAKVRVLSDENLSCASQVLGIVDVHESVANDEAALEILRRRAAALGADAVTGVEFRHGDGHERTHMSGTAVRCKDLLNGRAYDVIDHLLVRSSMGGEDAALDELKRKARDVGANLVIDVKFRHGESASDGLELSGTAVRAYDASKTHSPSGG